MAVLESKRRLLSVGAVLAIALSACGNDNPSVNTESAIRQTVLEWYAAIARADGAKACSLMTTTLRKQLAEAGPALTLTQDGHMQRTPATCAARITRGSKMLLIDEGISPSVGNAVVTKVDVIGDRATTFSRLGKPNTSSH